MIWNVRHKVPNSNESPKLIDGLEQIYFVNSKANHIWYFIAIILYKGFIFYFLIEYIVQILKKN